MTFFSPLTRVTNSAKAQESITFDGTTAGFMSLEQFLTPIQVDKTHPAEGASPGFRAPSVSNETGNFGGAGQGLGSAVGPTVHELDPYFPMVFAGDDGSTFFKENDFVSIFSDATTAEGHPRLDLDTFHLVDGGSKENITALRPMALRGPLIMTGWGFGSDDMPCPAKGAAWPETSQFHEETSKQRARWKTGPVHLMWDDERQVWHGGPRVVYGVVIGAVPKGNICNPSTFTVRLMRNTKSAKGDITDELGETITVHNRDVSLEQDKMENQIFCIAMKINYEWVPIWVGCPEEPACGPTGDGPNAPECLANQCAEL